MVDARFLLVLSKIHARLKDAKIPWVITGSLGMALQGMNMEVHDIDIQTNKDGAYAIEGLFSEYVATPINFSVSEKMRSHLGVLAMDGIKVEIMGDLQKRMNNQSWEEPVNVESFRQWLEVDGMHIPVLSLEYEYQAYLMMGRKEKAARLRDFLDKR